MKPKRKHKVAGWNKGRGKAHQWLVDHVNFDGPECLTWPFCTIPVGYGQVGYHGKTSYAHRTMCELVNGPAPTTEHEAAHSCGNGHRACVHPKHLSWKTPSENQLDRRRHGTLAHSYRWKPKLTPIQVIEIRKLNGIKTHDEIAQMYGVIRSNIGKIMTGKSWAKLPQPSE